jgi:hypothetical protein
MKYAIEANELEHAFDEVVCNEGMIMEMTQNCLSEQIIEGREVTLEEFDNTLNRLHQDKRELTSIWMGRELINKVNYEIPTSE